MGKKWPQFLKVTWNSQKMTNSTYCHFSTALNSALSNFQAVKTDFSHFLLSHRDSRPNFSYYPTIVESLQLFFLWAREVKWTKEDHSVIAHRKLFCSPRAFCNQELDCRFLERKLQESWNPELRYSRLLQLDPQLLALFTLKELEAALRNLQSRKAPGIDNIPVEFLQVLLVNRSGH